MRRVSPKHLWNELERLTDGRRATTVTHVADDRLTGDPSRQTMPGTIRFDGAEGHPGLGDETYMAHSPLLSLSLVDDEWRLHLPGKRLLALEPVDPDDLFAPLRRLSARYGRDETTPFAGALAGYLSYEIGERLMGLEPRPLDGPAALFFLHDRIARRRDAGWEIVDAGLRADRNLLPVDEWAEGLAAFHAPVIGTSRLLSTAATDDAPELGALPRGPADLARPRDARPVRLLADSLPEAAFRERVEAIQRYIAAGDVYQANLTRMLSLGVALQPQHYYAALRVHHPGPFSTYLVEPSGAAVVGISPELFLRVAGDRVETRPIKGTRPRGATPDEDARLRAELLASEKDAAELVMIVDLMRNDLGRVARFGTVQVTEDRRLDAHPSLFHLSGVVEARLDPDHDVWDLLAATLPAGSITGAPKRRAMEILAELEPHPRGVYTGAMGLIDFGGNAILNVAIRTVRLKGDRGLLGVGCGIVADSDPAAEHAEAMDKARAFFLSSPAGGDR